VRSDGFSQVLLDRFDVALYLTSDCECRAVVRVLLTPWHSRTSCIRRDSTLNLVTIASATVDTSRLGAVQASNH
jgi:hypothetical protein